ncbi:uncharacterized protein OCT59_001802 [Rhizophagus irregularis]|uniref:Uncharacterized protein n=1 Tax=Rhizophagus irregularis (strain DAOM 197198w) TaxID=1432141 RepID=A0A015JBH4_RHIIW|nr:hypothetical protein RirG_254510 [Rhizophagus irregularis DAOM 197198w]UZO10204.1 hypothetical protein OCT59_001802 [Rhizophagus irregularis]GBC41130.1 hypothetical protein GLOIN_2v1720020 [Rhizophagus irregularis DAOM 181602=DAOM 197198]
MGKSLINFDELYLGAYAEKACLEIKLRKLNVCEANEQFPESKKLTNKYDNKIINLESEDVVDLNGASAKSADIYEIT